MTDINEAFRAGVDAVKADNAINKGAFADAIRTVLTARFTNAEATAWIDAIAAEYARLGVINNATYNNLRGSIISADDADEAEALFAALASITGLPETEPAEVSARLIDLRADRDNIAAALTRLDDLIAAEPSAGGVGKLTKAVFRNGKDLLVTEKRSIRDAIQIITGDPDN